MCVKVQLVHYFHAFLISLGNNAVATYYWSKSFLWCGVCVQVHAETLSVLR